MTRHPALASTCSLLLVLLFQLALVVATGVSVSNRHQLEHALADDTVDTILITAPFPMASDRGLPITRSVSIIGRCQGPEPLCVLTVGGSADGPALQIDPEAPAGAFIQIEGISFRGQKGGVTGAAVACHSCAPMSLYLRAVAFEGLRTEHGALELAGDGCLVTCVSCQFTGNVAVHHGGGAHISSGYLACFECVFKDNFAKMGGAIYVRGGHTVLTYATFSGNGCEDAGPDVSIDALQTDAEGMSAVFSYCPAALAPDTRGSLQAPSPALLCAGSEQGLPGAAASPRHGVTSGRPEREIMEAVEALPPPPPQPLSSQGLLGPGLSLAAPEIARSLPQESHSPPYLLLDVSATTSTGSAHVHQGIPFTLHATLELVGNLANVKLDVTIQVIKGPPSGDGGDVAGCGGYQLLYADASAGYCSVLRAGACSLVCYLEGVQGGTQMHVDVNLVALDVGARLNMSGAAIIDDGTRRALPVLIASIPDLGVRPIEALHPLIMPRTSEGSFVTSLLEGAQVSFFVGTSPLLSFIVTGTGARFCDLERAVAVIGEAQVEKLAMGMTSSLMFSFDLAAPSHRVLRLTVPPGVCFGTNGTSNPESDAFALLVDFTRPSVLVASKSGPRTREDLASFIIQFSERVSGFSERAILVENGVLTCLKAVDAGTGTYEATVATKHDALCSVTVKDNAARDMGLNPSTVSNTAFVEHYVGKPAVAIATTASLAVSIGISAVASIVTGGATTGALASFIGHMQFFQMIGSLHVPLDVTLREATHSAAWINNEWPWSISVRRDARRELGSPQGRSWNGSCQRYKDEARVEDHGADTGCLYEKLLQIAEESYPDPIPTAQEGRDELMYFYSAADVGDVVMWSLFELLACLAARLLLQGALLVVDRWHAGGAPDLELLRFPRPELLVLMLTFPGVAQACAFAMTGGFKLGPLLGISVLVLHPLAFFIFSAHFILVDMLWRKECVFLVEALPPDLGSPPLSPSWNTVRDPGMAANGVPVWTPWRRMVAWVAPARSACQGSWTDLGMTSRRDYVLHRPKRSDLKLQKWMNESDQNLKGPVATDAVSGNFGLLESITSSQYFNAAGGGSSEEGPWSEDGLGSPDSTHALTVASSPRLSRACSFWREEVRCTAGHFQSAYMIVKFFKQLFFAMLAGMSPRWSPRLGWYQVCFFTPWLIFQFLFLIVLQPFNCMAAGAVELIATVCQLVALLTALMLLVTRAEKGTATLVACSNIMLALMALTAAVFLVYMVHQLASHLSQRKNGSRLGNYLTRMTSDKVPRSSQSSSLSSQQRKSSEDSGMQQQSTRHLRESRPPPPHRPQRRHSWPPRGTSLGPRGTILMPSQSRKPPPSGKRRTLHDDGGGQWPVHPAPATDRPHPVGSGQGGTWQVAALPNAAAPRSQHDEQWAVHPAPAMEQPNNEGPSRDPTLKVAVMANQAMPRTQGAGRPDRFSRTMSLPSSSRASPTQPKQVDSQAGQVSGEIRLTGGPPLDRWQLPRAVLPGSGGSDRPTTPDGISLEGSKAIPGGGDEGRLGGGRGEKASRPYRSVSLQPQQIAYHENTPSPGEPRPRRKSRLSIGTTHGGAVESSPSPPATSPPSPSPSSVSPRSLSPTSVSPLPSPPSSPLSQGRSIMAWTARKSLGYDRPLPADASLRAPRRKSLADGSPLLSRVQALYGKSKDGVVRLDGSTPGDDVAGEPRAGHVLATGVSSTTDDGSVTSFRRAADGGRVCRRPDREPEDREGPEQRSARRRTISVVREEPPPRLQRRTSLPGSNSPVGSIMLEYLELPKMVATASSARLPWDDTQGPLDPGKGDSAPAEVLGKGVAAGRRSRMPLPPVVYEDEESLEGGASIGQGLMQGKLEKLRRGCSVSEVQMQGSGSEQSARSLQEPRRHSVNASIGSPSSSPGRSLREDQDLQAAYPGVPLRSAPALNAETQGPMRHGREGGGAWMGSG
eukprot:jgi/Mesvir1/6451/Mv19531-RA.1